MATKVTFTYLTGIKKALFRNVNLQGSWDTNGNYSAQWTSVPMKAITGEDGCPAFQAIVTLNSPIADTKFNWGVGLDGPGGTNLWGINTEVNDPNDNSRYLSFTLNKDAAAQTQTFYLTYKRRLGANKIFPASKRQPEVRFSVWAPNAQKVEVVFGTANGYITTTGVGIDPALPVISLAPSGLGDGIWNSGSGYTFKDYQGRFYMFRITNAQGAILYRTDIFARQLVGKGNTDPENGQWDGTAATLDGTVGCAIITDPDQISTEFPLPKSRPAMMTEAVDFWKDEFNPDKPVPASIDDLVIYELHIGALGNTPGVPGNLQDAIALLDYLTDLGINAIELLPIAEFFGTIGWGYGDTHHMVIDSSAGGRDEYRWFIKQCHQRGIAVIQDVVYNHYDSNANRAEWQYDSVQPQENIYFWYEGLPADYPGNPNGGYLNNGSAGWSPNFREQVVRQQFISSAAFFVDEMHIDGFRVDLTQAIHRDNSLNNPPWSQVGEANQFGCKLLREWGRTLRLIHPNVILMAEDYSGYDMVTTPVSAGGFGFNAVWFADFFHGLVGYQGGPQLLVEAGFGDRRDLDIAGFSALHYQSQFNKVVYHINHDDAGANNTHRTVVTAVNSAALTGDTRKYAEARSRVVFSLSLLSAGTPLFFMGEEIAAAKPYTYNNFINNREDLQGGRLGIGAHMFRFYQDLITMNKRYVSIRSKNIDILHANNSNRVIIYKRWEGTEQVLIASSLNNAVFPSFTLNTDIYRLPDGGWKEIFNSDASIYGGSNTGNASATLTSKNGSLTMALPANGTLVFVKVS